MPYVIFVIFFYLTLIIMLPFVAIWAVNTLFGLDILYTWLNWFATVILIVIAQGGSIAKN